MISLSSHTKQVRPRRYRRRAIVLVSIVQLQVYERFCEREAMRPLSSCPDGCCGRWWVHSCFRRDWVDEELVVHRLTITRLQCSVCRGVWSLFPAFVWYRFRFCYRVVQFGCWRVLSGISPVTVSEQLASGVSPIVGDRTRVPAENTIRSWLKWLGNLALEQLVRWTLSEINRRCSQAAREVVPMLAISSSIPAGPARTRQRARRFLTVCSALDAAKRGRTNLFRRAPYQLRDWAITLFCERRQVLARPP